MRQEDRNQLVRCYSLQWPLDVISAATLFKLLHRWSYAYSLSPMLACQLQVSAWKCKPKSNFYWPVLLKLLTGSAALHIWKVVMLTSNPPISLSQTHLYICRNMKNICVQVFVCTKEMLKFDIFILSTILICYCSIMIPQDTSG